MFKILSTLFIISTLSYIFLHTQNLSSFGLRSQQKESQNKNCDLNQYPQPEFNQQSNEIRWQLTFADVDNQGLIEISQFINDNCLEEKFGQQQGYDLIMILNMNPKITSIRPLLDAYMQTLNTLNVNIDFQFINCELENWDEDFKDWVPQQPIFKQKFQFGNDQTSSLKHFTNSIYSVKDLPIQSFSIDIQDNGVESGLGELQDKLTENSDLTYLQLFYSQNPQANDVDFRDSLIDLLNSQHNLKTLSLLLDQFNVQYDYLVRLKGTLQVLVDNYSLSQMEIGVRGNDLDAQQVRNLFSSIQQQLGSSFRLYV